MLGNQLHGIISLARMANVPIKVKSLEGKNHQTNENQSSNTSLREVYNNLREVGFQKKTS